MIDSTAKSNRADKGVERRSLLRTATGAAITLSVGVPALSACDTTSDNTAQQNTDVNLPRYIRYGQVNPDIAASTEYGTPGFLKFPDPPVQTTQGKPSAGGTIRVSVALQAAVPVPMDRNSWWQNINSMLGAELKLDYVPAAQYPAKLATLLAGNDIPDIVQITALPNKAKTLQARFAELGEYLSGDAINDYPLLANIPTSAWKNVVFNGGIYGVPMPVLPVSSRLAARQDVLTSLGLSSTVKSSDEFLELCRALTDAKTNRWAMLNTQPTGFFGEMFGIPNAWSNDNGKFTRDIETDEYLATLQFIKKMWDEGLFHPDSFSGSIDTNAMFKGRRVSMITAGGNGMIATYNLFKQADPNLEVSFLAPPKADGSGQAAKFLGAGFSTFVALNKEASKSRIEELLRVLNTLAAPFGSREYLAVQYGAENSDYTWDPARGGPVTTQKATAEKIPVNYIPGTPNTYYAAGHPEVVQTACDYENIVLKSVAPWPTAGLYSPTADSKDATLNKQILSAVSDVVQGRKPLSSWSDTVKAWRSGGGDQIRAEYEEQVQNSGN